MRFNGEGGKLLVTFLLYWVAPVVVGVVIYAIFGLVGAGMAAATGGHGHHRGDVSPLVVIFPLIGALIMMGILAVGGLLLANKLFAFRMENLVIEGQSCRYTGTLGGLAGVFLVSFLLMAITFGFYTPWAIVRFIRFMYENTEVNGQRGRLTFNSDGGAFFGTWLLGQILTSLTCYIYGAWYMNDVFAFIWENTRLDGNKTFGFKKDGGGFVGTWLITLILGYFTGGIYYPWGLCNIWKWEAERVS